MAQDARKIEEVNTQNRAHLLGLRYLDVRTLQSRPLYDDILSVDRIKSDKVVAIVSSENGTTFAVTTNTPPKVKADIRTEFNDRPIDFVLISDSAYAEYVQLYDPPEKIEYQDIVLSQNQADSLAKVSATLNSVKPDDMLAYIVSQAFKLKASDIHLETTATVIKLRFRVHGVLHPIAQMSVDRYRMLVGSIASAANISTSAGTSQTSHIGSKYTMQDGTQVDVNLRIETIPALNGMDIVMRMFNFDASMLKIDSLGLNDLQTKQIGQVISKPSGLVLVVGPTGSGKSTTLYSMLNELRSPERKVVTLEDPVEYQIDGITQVPINTGEGASFAAGLRSVLRLDPDVIMVGEIRDDDTARTALQSALTGHLVLSTYHAGSTSAAMARVLDATQGNPLFLSAIRFIQAQRLVRRLDDDSKVQYTPDQRTADYVKAVVDSFPPDIPKPDLTNLVLYRAGKSEANPFGYGGQFAVREIMLMTEEMQAFINSNKEVTASQIESFAVGTMRMPTLLQYGVLAAVEGKTSLEEVARVIV